MVADGKCGGRIILTGRGAPKPGQDSSSASPSQHSSETYWLRTPPAAAGQRSEHHFMKHILPLGLPGCQGEKSPGPKKAQKQSLI